MAKAYHYIFFDLDHTIWDHDSNSAETLKELYDSYSLSELGITNAETLFSSFVAVNDRLWPMYNEGKIDKFYLRNERFRLVFEEAGVTENIDNNMLKNFNKEYLTKCPQKPALIDGASEVLDELKGRYPMYIITNGFEEIQNVKMESADIQNYFEKVITSEKAGFKKPHKGIFYYAMKHCQANPEASIMIGDNLQTDIKGAREYGIDQVYYNPNSLRHGENVTHEIYDLRQLLEIL